MHREIVYKYFSGAGEVYVNTYLAPEKDCRRWPDKYLGYISLHVSDTDPALEKALAAFIYTSPAPEKYTNIIQILLRRSIYTNTSPTSEKPEKYLYTPGFFK